MEVISKVQRTAVRCSLHRMDGWRRVANRMQTTLMPCPWNVVEPVKLIASMINSSVRNPADAICKIELLRLQRMMKVPVPLKALQVWTGRYAHQRALGKLDLVWPARLAHACVTV